MQEQDQIDKTDFSRIKPYEEDQVHDALVRMLSNPIFQKLLDYLYPSETHEKLRKDLLAANSSLEFQKLFMYTGIKSVLEKTTPKGLHFEHEHYIKDGRAVAYVANHRDILLDSALLQLILVDLGLETSEISFGNNLMVSDFVNDFGRINRMFTVFRDGSPRELLQNAKNLSAYIQHTLKEKKRSIWIAHRKGRAKNGVDKTDLGVIKMLISSGKGNVFEAVRSIDIIPVSISYEWEPCDASKVRELYLKEFGSYTKSPGEDMNSVVQGIIGQKGGINLCFCQPVNEVLETFDASLGNNPFLNQIVDYMDQQMIENYKLWPSNYYAYDLASNSKEYAEFYDEKTVSYFQERLDKTIQLIGKDDPKIKQLFIDLYANPIRSKDKLRLHKAQ
jgi:hypothetical protein